jgi:hypothetical protein
MIDDLIPWNPAHFGHTDFQKEADGNRGFLLANIKIKCQLSVIFYHSTPTHP